MKWGDISSAVAHAFTSGKKARLRVSAKYICLPHLYLTSREYFWSWSSILCSHLGALLTGFYTMVSSG